jgi:hypothetical protein
MMIFDLCSSPRTRPSVAGTCANCGQQVFESAAILDDCYNVWAGKCPHCSAINLLSVNHGFRGRMFLVLPTDEERANIASFGKTESGGPLT